MTGGTLDYYISSGPPRPAGLGKHLFAWALARGGKTIDGVIAPRKQALLGGLGGDLLEIGPGSGANLAFFPDGLRWVGVEPNPFMHGYLREALRRRGIPPERYRIDPGDPRGIRLPAADASVDAVISTHVLCSVPDQGQVMQEILRVLKPGGQFVFIEHVAAPRGTALRAFQNFIQPLWTWVGEGCRPNRETWEAISGAGFARVEMDHFVYPGGGPVGPHISGRAVKA